MLIIPAIDLQDGCVVRLVQGRTDKKIYSRDPLKTAKHWVKQGAELLHVVDLDGAFTGALKNLHVVKGIAQISKVPVEFGGGVRDIETIERLINYGVWRVVLGTKAATDSEFLKKVFRRFQDRIIVSIDAKKDNVLIKGWKDAHKKRDVIGFAQNLKALGFKQVIYTDTLKDGTLSGPNIAGIKLLLKETGLKVIASGGISSLDDVYKLKKFEKQGLTGIIIGKALYEGKFTLTQAKHLFK
jgi:phosphoribosylformimino-5-aminoimidazole carboxamide ribotide isomerase